MIATLNYGAIPSLKLIQQAWDKQELTDYEIEARQHDWTLLANVVNQGIDSHLEAIALEEFDGRHGKGGLRILDPNSLHVLIRRLIETEDSSDDGAIDLASSILFTLDIEWI